jgi:YD repeat-containing protein
VSEVWQPDFDVNYHLQEILTVGVRTGWTVTTPDNIAETYSAIGDLLAINDPKGLNQTLTYSCTTISATCPIVTPNTIASSAGLLIRVTDSFDRSLNFTYGSGIDSGRIMTMTDPTGNITRYSYDANGNLATVTYSDATPAILTDNPKKTYVYGEPVNTANVSQPNALTGIIDENNVRYATYQYDATRYAISTEHATGGIEKYSLAYNPDGSTEVTDPLGSVRTTHFMTVLGVVKSTGTDQPGGSGCSAASSNITYDTNGNVASRTDFNGYKSCYAYDLSRNLETARIEGLPGTADCAARLTAASLTAPARKITTSWHANYRLPLQIAEPKKLITYNYDPAGNALTHAEQATTDVTGTAGLTPLVQGSPRTWTYTYNNLGQVLTADGPRTDVVDKTTYAYYPATDANLGNRGNLYTVTNALGQVTTLTDYDANGRVGTITGPNTLVTNLAYFPRGWLKTLTLTYSSYVETTQYT